MQSRKIMASTLTGALLLAALVGCTNKNESTQPQTSPKSSPAVVAPTSDSKNVSVATEADVSKQMAPPQKGDTVAVMTTSLGIIKLKFFPEVAPKSVENFTTHAKNGYYNGVKFHRILQDFMIQGGDPKGNGTGGESIWGKPFEDEVSPKLSNFRGALSMANAGPNTNGSQFFIVQNTKVEPGVLEALRQGNKELIAQMQLKKTSFSNAELNQYAKGGTPWLDLKHTVFGQVYAGMEIVDKIAAVELADPRAGVPKNEVKIEKIEISTF